MAQGPGDQSCGNKGDNMITESDRKYIEDVIKELQNQIESSEKEIEVIQNKIDNNSSFINVLQRVLDDN